MKVQILKLLDGAEKAQGLTVIIDVFRAFSLECYMYSRNAASVRPIGSMEQAFMMKKNNPNALLFGEREGQKVAGCDYGNSPASIIHEDLSGRDILHTTSAGTQGIAAAVHADEIITGALVNAAAVASYIQQKNPETVSLVPMGWQGERDTEEDILCAEYIKSILEGHPMQDIEEQALNQKNLEGKKFFDPMLQDRFPSEDFWLCTKVSIFPFILRIGKNQKGLFTEKIEIS